MNGRKRMRAALASLCLAGGGVACALPVRAQDGWDFLIAPYFLAPSIEGTASLGLAGGDVSVDPGDLFSNLEAGGMLRFEARHESNFGLYLDYSFMNFGEGATSRTGQVAADFDQSVLEGGVFYRFHDRGLDVLEVYAGARHWDVDADLGILSGPQAGQRLLRSANWTDPLIGLRWERQLSPDIRFSLQGDVSIGGGSDAAWNLMGGLVYDRWRNTSLFLAYRALGVDYDEGTPGTPSYFRYDTQTHALLAGIGFRF